MKRYKEQDKPKAWELIVFTVFMAGMVAAMMLAYNSVVPAYQ